MIDVLVLNGAGTMSSRSGIGRRRRFTFWRVASVVSNLGADMYRVRDMNPEEPLNMSVLLAFE